MREHMSGATVILQIEGDLLSEEAQEHLRGRVRSLVATGKNHLIIDLSRIRYINSCGLGSLVCAFTTLRKAGGDLRLAGAGSHLRDLFEITHLDRVFPLYPTSEQAISASPTIER